MRISWGAVALAIAAALLGGCGGSRGAPATSSTKQKPSAAAEERVADLEGPDVWVTLDGRAGAENVGVLIANRRGYFSELGFSVGAGAPLRPRRPIGYVSGRTADIGVTQQPQVVLAKAERAPIVAFGSLLPHSTLSMIWLRKSHIRDIADLKGKTVAVPGIPYQERFLQLLLAQAGLTRRDVHIRIVGYDLIRALEDGRADAIFGGSWNLEGAVLKERGLHPVIVPVRGLGIPPYDELVVIARSRRVARDPRLIRKFMAAVARGTAAAIEDPEAAVGVIEASDQKGYDLSHADIKAEVEATLPLLSRTAHTNRSRAKRLVAWMQSRGLIQDPLPLSTWMTDRYLPKAAGSSPAAAPRSHSGRSHGRGLTGHSRRRGRGG